MTNTFSAAEQPSPKQMCPTSNVFMHPSLTLFAFNSCVSVRDSKLKPATACFTIVFEGLQIFHLRVLRLTLQSQFLLRSGCPSHLHLPSFRCASTLFPFASGCVAEGLQDPVRLYHLRWFLHLHRRCNRRIPLPLSPLPSPLSSGSHLSIWILLARISQSPRNLHTPDICCL